MGDHIFKVLDPRMDLSKPTNYAIQDGARLVNFAVSNTASSGAGASSLTWTNSDPPGPGVVVDKKVLVAITYKLTFTRTDWTDANGAYIPGQPVLGYELLPGASYLPNGTDQVRALGTDGPRFLPIAQTTNSMTVIINNAAANGQLYDYIDPLMRYSASRDYMDGQLSLAPSQQDQFQDYGDSYTFGSGRNVLAAYGENSYQTNRGGFPLVWFKQNDVNNNPTNVPYTGTAIVYVTSYEPIFVSPCDFGQANQRGFYGVETFRVTLNTTGDLTRVWCHNAIKAKGGWPLASASAIIAPSGDTVKYSCGISSNLPALYFTYLTPKILQEPPKFNVYPYYYVDDQVFISTKSVAALSSDSYKTNSFKLDSVPRYLYVYVRESNNDRNYTTTDTYAFISKLSITFGNNINQLSSADPVQLYEMSVKNGCDMSWAQWSKYVGSVVCIDFSQDMSLPDDMFVGMRNPNTQLSVEVAFTNISDRTINYSIYVIPSYTGVFDITAGQAQSLSGIVSLQDYVNAKDVHTIDYVDAHNFYGGNFYNKLRDVGRALKPYAKEAIKLGRLAAPHLAQAGYPAAHLIGPASDILEQLLGAGYSHKQAQKMMADGSYVHVVKGKKKKAPKGGAKMSKKAMNNTLLSRAIGY